MTLATIFVSLFYLYLSIGLLFGLWFVIRGADMLDHNMHGSSWRTRLLLLPASTGLWIVLLIKLLKTNKHGS
ncbi:MAG: hypothetical protein IPJ74_20725 [Saprospiraceae bacterium]|nr:hypothetical protein [Saprospiraceae bacterium]